MWMFDLNTFGITYLSVTGALAALLVVALFVFAARKKATTKGTVWFRVLDIVLLVAGLVLCFACLLANTKVFGLSIESSGNTLNLLSGSSVLFGIPQMGPLADIWTSYIGIGLIALVTLLALVDLILAGVRRRKAKADDLMSVEDEADSDRLEAEKLEYEERERNIIDFDDPLSTKYRYENEVYYEIPGEEDEDDSIITMEQLRTDEPAVSGEFEYDVYYGIPGDFSDDVYDMVAELDFDDEIESGDVDAFSQIDEETMKADALSGENDAPVETEPEELPEEPVFDFAGEPEDEQQAEEIYFDEDETQYMDAPDDELLADEQLIASMLYGEPGDNDEPDEAILMEDAEHSAPDTDSFVYEVTYDAPLPEELTSVETPQASDIEVVLPIALEVQPPVSLYLGRDYSYLPRKTVIYERLPLSKKMDVENRKQVTELFGEYLAGLSDSDRKIIENSVSEVKLGEVPPKAKTAAKKKTASGKKPAAKKKVAAKKKPVKKTTAKKSAGKTAASKTKKTTTKTTTDKT